MKSLLRIIKLTFDYKKYILVSVFFNLLSSFFGLFSFVLLAPLLDVIFNQSEQFYIDLVSNGIADFSFSTDYFINYINYELATLIVEDGKISALLYVCVVVSSAVFLKNLFIYLSTLFVSILLNRSVGDMRNNIYQTLMHLPVAYLI